MQNYIENRYLDYTETDFINDSFFQDWVIKSKMETNLFWKKFLETHPEKKPAVESAKRFLLDISFTEEVLDDNYVHQHYLQHLSQVQSLKEAKIFGLNRATMRRFIAVASLIAGLILITSTLYHYTKGSVVESVVIATKFGEIKKVVLPDGSNITLNASSNVRFKKKWDENKPREIWLKGEGFIDVKPLNNRIETIKPFDKFLVHGEGYTIEVLGTSFDIRQRRGKTEVVLQTGKIKLTFSHNKKPIIMLPGDIVSYVSAENALIKSKTIPEDFSGWKEKKLILNNPTLQEITHYLEDNYGKKIVIDNEKIKDKKIEGVIELNNLDDALFIISTVLNTDIERKNNTILIKTK